MISIFQDWNVIVQSVLQNTENMTTIYPEPSYKQLDCFTNIILIITL